MPFSPFLHPDHSLCEAYVCMRGINEAETNSYRASRYPSGPLSSQRPGQQHGSTSVYGTYGSTYRAWTAIVALDNHIIVDPPDDIPERDSGGRPNGQTGSSQAIHVFEFHDFLVSC